MLFAHRNGLEHAIGDSAEVEVLQNLACEIGPRVDGIVASRAVPQAMGAYSTAGAQGACVGRGQQTEQHTPTTLRNGLGLGEGVTLAPTAPAPTAPAPTRFSKLVALTAFRPGTAALLATDAKLLTPTVPDAVPDAVPLPDATGHPPGTIAAFSVKTNQWRIAIPRPALGLGIFGATAAFVEVASAAAPPAGATQVSENTLLAKTGQLPFFKNPKSPLFWVALAGGVVVLGGGSYLLLRRRKSI